MNEVKVFQRAIFLCLFFSYTTHLLQDSVTGRVLCYMDMPLCSCILGENKIQFYFNFTYPWDPYFQRRLKPQTLGFLNIVSTIAETRRKHKFQGKVLLNSFKTELKQQASFLVLWPSGNNKTTEQSTFSLALEHILFSLSEDIGSSLGRVFLAWIFWQPWSFTGVCVDSAICVLPRFH